MVFASSFFEVNIFMSKSGLKVDVRTEMCTSTFNPLLDMKILTSEKTNKNHCVQNLILNNFPLITFSLEQYFYVIFAFKKRYETERRVQNIPPDCIANWNR